jgi:hypothetical protein
MIIACDTFFNAGDMINSWHAETGKHSYLQILRHATFEEWEAYSLRSSREIELAIKELTHYYEVAEVVRGNPVLPITDSIMAWVKAERYRRALPLTQGGTRANLSLADAILLVEEIERLRESRRRVMAKGIVTCDGQIINVGDVVRTETGAVIRVEGAAIGLQFYNAEKCKVMPHGTKTTAEEHAEKAGAAPLKASDVGDCIVWGS